MNNNNMNVTIKEEPNYLTEIKVETDYLDYENAESVIKDEQDYENTESVIKDENDSLIKVEVKEEKEEYCSSHDILNSQNNNQIDNNDNSNNEMNGWEQNSNIKTNLMILYENHDVKDDIVVGPECIQEKFVEVNNKVFFKNSADVKHHKNDITNASKSCKNTKNKYIGYNKDSNEKTKLINDMFVCDVCSRVYKRKNYLILHLQKHDSNIVKVGKPKSKNRKYRCNLCNITVAHKNNLETHKRLHLNDDAQRKYECKICCKKFKRSDALKTHRSLHTGEKPFYCEVCKKHFREKAYYNQHRCLNPKGTYKFTSQKLKGKKIYICDICDKRYHMKYDLERHICSHMGIMQIKCDICQKTFSRPHSLKLHLQTHSGKSMYRCGICAKGFRRNWILKQHLKRFHPKQL